MSKIGRGRISERIYRQLSKKGLLKEIKILRNGKNAFGEKQEDLYVCTVEGYYYRKDSKIIYRLDDAASVNEQYTDKLLVNVNDESLKIKRDDYFYLNDTKFLIVDTNNIEDIIFDMYLRRL